MSFQDSVLNQISLFPVKRMETENPSGSKALTVNKTSESFSRKDYNRTYYLQNKQRLAEKKRNRQKKNVLQLFSSTKVPSGIFSIRISGIFKWVELAILIALTVLMTQYLVKESARFYLEGNESLISAYLKATMVEGIAILFSFSRGKRRSLRIAQRGVMVLLCGLTLFTMSGSVVRTAVQDTTKYRTMTQSIKDLETEQAQKEQLREKFMNREWIGATRRIDKDLAQIRRRLEGIREGRLLAQAPDVITNGLIILIIFRFLVVAANLICIHLVVEILNNGAARKIEDFKDS